jgi:O-methyltransferase
VGRSGADYALADKSISVCIVDCDLYEPTVQVLDFISPLLDDGALIYFDDWRLTRASPHVGERAAALQWLAANPAFELIDFPGDTPPQIGSWQGQWFIFQRR